MHAKSCSLKPRDERQRRMKERKKKGRQRRMKERLKWGSLLSHQGGRGLRMLETYALVKT
jgi:hypothetical protein